MSNKNNNSENKNNNSENKNNIEYIEQIHQKDLPTSWEDESLGITMNILRGIYNYGFEKPSPIQSKAIYHMKNMRDIIAQSQSGTGKTAAFIVSALLSIDESKKKTQVLILSPTRELTIQTYEVCKEIIFFYIFIYCISYWGTIIR